MCFILSCYYPCPDITISNKYQKNTHICTVGSRFTTGLRPRIFGCKSNRRKTSTI